jgi:phage terminase large subunit
MNNDISFWQQNPGLWIEKFLDIKLYKKQWEICNAVATKSRVSIRSAHGMGKSLILAAIFIWFLYTHKDSKALTTATSWAQVENVLWSEIAKLHNRLKEKVTKTGELLQTRLKIGPNWFGFGFSTDKPDTLQGIHAENLLLIVDEAAGVPLNIFEPAMSLMTSGKGNKMVLIGNPTDPNGFFAETHRDPRLQFHCIHISAFDSPNIEQDEEGNWRNKDPMPYEGQITSYDWIEEIRRTKGEGSSYWVSRVEGDFSTASDDQLIDGRYIAAAMHKGAILRRLLKRLNEDQVVLSSQQIAQLTGRVDNR